MTNPIQILRRNVMTEACRLVWKVEDGELTRSELEDAVALTGDGEPALALQILDALEIK